MIMYLPTPYLGMGTWGMGGKYERDTSNVDESVDALRFGLSIGLKIIDVAEIYGEGLAEEIVGQAIRGKRADAYVISKVWKTNLRHDDVLRAAEGSLKRLDTDYIDLYLVHWPSEEGVPLEETMSAMERLVDEKLVRAIGVSNFSSAQMREAQNHLKNTKIVADQFEYNLAVRDAEVDTIPYCRENDIDIIAYRPLGKGALARSHDTLVDELAAKYSKTSSQILLNWILSQDMIAIPKASNQAHIRENAGALGWRMADEDIERLHNLESSR